MAYDEELADRVRRRVADRDDVTERAMFGGLAVLAGGAMAVAISGRGGSMVRVEPADAAASIERPGVAPMEMRGRRTTGWLLVDDEARRDDAALDERVAIGVARALSLDG